MPSVNEIIVGGGLPHSLAYKLGGIPNVAQAAAGSTQADAASLVMATWVIVTTASASQGIILPNARGQPVTAILNASGQTIKLYGALTELINNIASATGITLTNGKACIAIPATNAWIAIVN